MPITANKQEFRRLIERRFLSYAVKPARFLATEWRKGAADKSATLAVIVSGASYESSLTNPLSSAVFETLLDSGLCDIGWLYQFGDEASARLSSIGAAPFITPQLARVSDAGLIIVPLSRPAEVYSAIRNLIRAGIVFGEVSEVTDKKNYQAKLIAVTDSKSCHESLNQTILNEIFDRVFSLSELRIALESMRKSGADLSDLPGVEANGQSERLYFPVNPPGPVVEVSQNRACFRFSEGPTTSERPDDSIVLEQSAASGQSMAAAILDSGQTEFQIERCYRAGAQIEIAEALDRISAGLLPERYSATLAEFSLRQISNRLPGALRRFRRARIDIKLPSLSDSVNQSLGRPFEIAPLVERLKTLQRLENIQVQLTVSLGFPGDSNIETEETIKAIRTLSQALNPRSGLKIRFVHFTPQSVDTHPGDPVRGIQEVQEMFETVRCRKARGIALTFLDSTPYLLDVLIGNGAFSTLSSLINFANDSHNIAKRDSAGAIELLEPYQKYFSRQSVQSTQTEVAPHNSSAQVISSLAHLESEHECVTQLSNFDDDFGRGRKRSGGAGAGGVAAPTKTRVRFTWKISSHARFLSHLDNLRALEGALLRSRLLLSYTQGVRPRPKVSFGPPLPVGFTSDCELFDAFFELAPTVDELERFFRSLPQGFEITRHETVYTKALSILEEVSAAAYIVRLPSGQSQAALSEKLESALGAPRLMYQRKTKTGVKEIDLRPGVFAAEIDRSANEEPIALKLTLALTDTFTIRPEDFLQAAGIIESEQTPELIVHRSKFHIGRMAAFRRAQEIVNEKVVSEEV